MHQQSLTAYGQPLEATQAETPVPQGSELVVKISHCGVCHSDLHMIDGYFDLGRDKKLDVTGGRKLPFTLGHEIAGEIVAVGPDVEGVAIGQTCAVYPWMGCGECSRCAAGDEHLCRTTHHLGITVDGGYASHVRVPHSRYVFDISGIDEEIAGSLMCSGITAYGALKKALGNVQDGPLIIVGAGGVGMMGLQIARALSDVAIAVADIDPVKRQAAKDAGADFVFDPAEPGIRKTVLKTCGAGDAAIDFVGAESSLNFASSVIGKGGSIVVAGLLGGAYSTPIPMFALRPFSIHGVFVASLPDTHELLELVRAGKIKPIPVTTRPLEEANLALDDLRGGKVVGRVVLKP
jgi:D-arabinose 1-dehydrogenase-like Zn-dependent alcohol dehydrogenase